MAPPDEYERWLPEPDEPDPADDVPYDMDDDVDRQPDAGLLGAFLGDPSIILPGDIT